MVESSNIAKRREMALSEGNLEYTAKRNELVRVAVGLFRTQGYQATTLAQIGQAAGMDRATIYYYFASKEELFRAAVEGILDRNLAHAETVLLRNDLDARAKLLDLIKMLMQSYSDSYPHMYVYIQELMHQIPREPSNWGREMLRKTRRFETIIRSVLQEGVAEGSFRADVSLRLAINALFGMLNWTHRWFDPAGRYSAEQVADAFCKVFAEGMQSTCPSSAAVSA